MSDVPLCVLLSGGVDSSTITALASESHSNLSAFSMGFDEAPDELEYSRQVASLFDLDYTEKILSADKLDSLLDEIIYYYDEPLADSSVFPTFLLMREVSNEFKVALGGDGGDELFAGYNWYDRYMLFKNLNRFAPFFSYTHSAVESVNNRLQNSYIQSVESGAELASLKGMKQYISSKKFPISNDELKEILAGPYADKTDDEPVEQYATKWNSIKDLQCFDMQTFLPSILTKVDRASMANSLEVRVPFLDRGVAEYSLSLGDEIHYTTGEKKKSIETCCSRFSP